MYGYSGGDADSGAFRKEAILFERAFSHAPLTSLARLPLHRHPSRRPRTEGQPRLPAERQGPTIAELLKKAGYATGGAISSIVLNGASGNRSRLRPLGGRRRASVAGQPLGRVPALRRRDGGPPRGWVERQPAGQPFFAFPPSLRAPRAYEPPEPYAAR